MDYKGIISIVSFCLILNDNFCQGNIRLIYHRVHRESIAVYISKTYILSRSRALLGNVYVAKAPALIIEAELLVQARC